jgi:hypothetical protein
MGVVGRNKGSVRGVGSLSLRARDCLLHCGLELSFVERGIGIEELSRGGEGFRGFGPQLRRVLGQRYLRCWR